MMTENTSATAAYLDRYKEREQFTGEDGRAYKVRALYPAEIFKLRDMLQGADPATFNVMVAIASCCSVYGGKDGRGSDWFNLNFPKSRGELDSILNSVGLKGLAALTTAFNNINGDDEPEKPADEADAA